MLGRAVLEREFPTVTAACRARGIDPVTDPIPVAPGAHYACGGIRTGLDGQTSVRGLYAVGEAASTGVHGANRLASNSLTEALIFGRRAGNLLGGSTAGAARPPATARVRTGVDRPSVRRWPQPCHGTLECCGTQASWKVCGRRWERSAGQLRLAGWNTDLAIVEATNRHSVAVVVAAAALDPRGKRRLSPMA